MKQKLTRITSLLLAFIMTFSMLLVPVQAVTFTDVPDGAWYQAAVEYVHEKGWMSGVSETEFAPKVDVTRAMFVLVLARIAEAELDNDVAAFTDTPAGKWYTGAAAWASELGIAAGIGDGMFAPNRSITRQDLCTMLYKFVTVKGYPLTATQTRMFSDETAISAYAREAVSFCAATGLVSGFDDGTFRAKETATRAQTAQILMRLDMLLNGEEAPTDPMPAQSFSDDCGDGSAVNVNAPKGALPEGTVMTATPVTDEAVLAAIRSQIDGELVTAHDITFTKDGEEIEPESEVEVRISAEELLACENPTVYHFDAAGVAESVGAQHVTQNADGEAELSFSAKDFSIYVVADSASTSVKLTVQFKDKNGTLLNRQTIRKDRIVNANEGDLLVCDPGVRTMKQGQGFFGWMATNKAEPQESDLLQIDEINKYIITTFGEIGADTTVTFYAGVFDAVKILYYNQTGAVIDVQMERLTTGDAKTMTVNMNYSPLHSTHMLVDWVEYDKTKIAPSQDLPTYNDDNENPLTHYSNGSTVSVSKNAPLELFPYIDAGYWISFDNNVTYNNQKLEFDDPTTADYIQPIQVRKGTKFKDAGLPTRSNRPGYDLVRWHTAPMWEVDEPNVFDPEAVITRNMTLYAEWAFGEATYTIIFWKEKCDYTGDELNYETGKLNPGVERRYSFVEADTVTTRGSSSSLPHTGDRIRIGDDTYLPKATIAQETGDTQWSAGNFYSYKGGKDAPYRFGKYKANTDDFYFEIDRENSDNYARVRGDGSTILNVRYNRKICSAKFYDTVPIVGTNTIIYPIPTNKVSKVYNGTSDGSKKVNVNDVYCYFVSATGGYKRGYVYPNVTDYTKLESNGQIELRYLEFKNGSDTYSISNRNLGSVYHLDIGPSYTKKGPYGCRYYTIPTSLLTNAGRLNLWVNYSELYTERSDAFEKRFGVDDSLPRDRTDYNFCGMYYVEGEALNAHYYKQSVDGGTYSPDYSVPMKADEVIYQSSQTSEPFYFFSVDLATSQRRTEPSLTANNINLALQKTLAIQEDRGEFTRSPTEFLWPNPETNTTTYAVLDKKTATYPDHYDLYFYLNRRKYNLTYMSENTPLKTEAVYYDANLAPYESYEPGVEAPKPGDHYVFAGWYEDPTCTQKANFNTTMPQGGVVVYAKWVPVRYRVMLDFYNGVPKGETIKFPIGLSSTYLLKNGASIPSMTVAVADRENYVFDGWYLEPECKNQVNLESMHVTDSLPGMDLNYGSRSDDERKGTDEVNGLQYDDTVDANWDVQRKLTLYAKWTRRVENGNGIEVIYHADEEPDTEKVGEFTGKEGKLKKVYPEGLVYSDHTWVPSYAASTALTDGWRYYRWRLLDQNLQPTGTTFFPGETFLLDAQYAVESPIYDVVENVTQAWSQEHEHSFDGQNHEGQAPTCTEDGWYDISYYSSVVNEMRDWCAAEYPGREFVAQVEECVGCGIHFLVVRVDGEVVLYDPAILPYQRHMTYDSEQRKFVTSKTEEIVDGVENRIVDGKTYYDCEFSRVVKETCTQCGETFYYLIRPGKHDWEYLSESKQPTCTESGSAYTRECKICKKYETGDTQPPLGHDWDSGVVTKEATCTTGGEKRFTCNRCGETELRPTSALGHTAAAPTFSWSGLPTTNTIEWNAVENYTVTCTQTVRCSTCDSVITSATVNATPDAVDSTCTQTGTVSWVAEFTGDSLSPSSTSNQFTIGLRPGKEARFYVGTSLYTTLYGTEPSNNFQVAIPAISSSEPQYQYGDYTFCGWTTDSDYSSSVDTPPSGYYTNGMNYQFGSEESSKNFYAVYKYTENVERVQLATGSLKDNDVIVITSAASGGKMLKSTNSNSTVNMTFSDGKLNAPEDCRLTLTGGRVRNHSGYYLIYALSLTNSAPSAYEGAYAFGTGNPRTFKISQVSNAYYVNYNGSTFTAGTDSSKKVYVWKVSNVDETHYDRYPSGVPATAAPAEPAAKRNTQGTKSQKQGGTVSLDRMVDKSSGLAQYGDKEAVESLRTEQVQPARLETGLLHNDLNDPKTAAAETLARKLTTPLGNASFQTYQLVDGPTAGNNYLMAILVGSEYRIVTNKYYYSNHGPQLQAVSVEDGKIVASDLTDYEFTALGDGTVWEFRNKSFYLSLTNDSAHNVALLPQQIPGSDPTQYNDTHWLIETTAGKKYLKNTTTGTNYVYVGSNGNYLSSVFASKKMPIYFFQRNNVKYTLTMHYYKRVFDYNIGDYVLEKAHDDYVGEYEPGDWITLLNPTINGYTPDYPLINDSMPSHDVEMDVIYDLDPTTGQSEIWERVPEGSPIETGKPYLLVASIYDDREYFMTDGDKQEFFNENYAMIMSQSDVAVNLDLPGISTKHYRDFVAERTNHQTGETYYANTRGGWTAFPGDFFFDKAFISEAYLNTIDTRYDSEAQVVLPAEYLTNCQWTFTDAGDGDYYISSVVDPNYRLSWDYGGLFPSTAFWHQTWNYDWETHHLFSVGPETTQYVHIAPAPDSGAIGSSMGSTLCVQSFVTDNTVPGYQDYCSEVYLYQRKSYTEEEWRVYAFDDDGETVFATPQVKNDPDGPDGPKTGVTLRQALSSVNPYKENWTFVRWTAMNGDAINLDQEVHSNISVRALYTPNYRSTYAVHVQATYIPSGDDGQTHIYWYANNGTTKNNRGGARMEDTALTVDQAVTIPLPYWTDTGYHPLPTPNDPSDQERVFCEDVNFLRETGLSYNGYVFLGWAQVPNNGSDIGADHSDLTSADLFLEWVNGHYEEVTSGGTSDTVWVPGHYIDPTTGNTVTEVAPGDLNADTDFYAVWEPLKYFFVFHSATGNMIAYDWNVATQNGTRPFNLVDHVEDGYLYGGYYSAYAPISYAEEQYLLYNLYKQVGGGTAPTYYQWTMAEDYYNVPEPTDEVLGNEGEKAFFFGATTDTYLGRYNYVDYNGDLTTSVYSQVPVNGTTTYVRNKKIWDSNYAYKGVDNIGTALRPQPGAVYYIKEVPSYYLTSKIAYTYSTDSNKYCDLQDMWMLSLTDDNNYADVGFQYSSGENMTALLDSAFISRETFAKTVNFKDKEGNVTARFNASSFFPNDGVLQENCGIVFALHRKDLASLLQGGMNQDPGSFSMVPAWYTLDTVYVQNNAINWSKRVLGEGEQWGNAEALDQTGLLTGLRGLLTTSRLYVDSTGVTTHVPTKEFPGWIFANRFVTVEPDPEDPGKPVEEPDGSSFLGEGTWWNDVHNNWCLVPEISGFYRYLLLLTPGEKPEDEPTYVKYQIDLHTDSLKLANAENVDGVMVGGWDFMPDKQVAEDDGDDPEPEP